MLVKTSLSTDTNAGLGSSFIVVQEPELLIDPGSTVTVGAGKTLVTDLFMLNNRPDLNPNLRLTTLSVTGVTTLGIVTGVDSIGVDDIYATNVHCFQHIMVMVQT